jgi:hypothetical protein
MIRYSSYKSQSITITGVGYHFSDLHLCTTKGDKILAFDGVGVLSLSLDKGATYPITLDLTGICNIITRARIYPNGNIMWANHTKCFYSTDDLATYHESTVLDINGDPFVPTTYDNFKVITNIEDVIINGIVIDVWGNYSILAGTQDDNINCWYTIDSGVTIKSCFKAGVSLSGQAFRHIHAVNFISVDNSFWMHTGDGSSGKTDCFWNKGTYNTVTDTWTWENKKAGQIIDLCKSTGFAYYNGYVYWGSDSSSEGYKGIYKCLYSDILDESKYVKVVDTTGTYGQIVSFFGGANGVIIANEVLLKRLHISVDFGATWSVYDLTGGVTLDADLGMYCAATPANSDGYYRYEIAEPYPAEGYNFVDLTKGQVLMLRVK